MHQPKVYQTPDGSWTFSFEGQECLNYWPNKDFPDMVQVGGVYMSKEDLGLPNAIFPEGTYGVYRAFQRMINGRSREVTLYHRGKIKKVEAGPEIEELRAKVAKLDEEAYPDEPISEEHAALKRQLAESRKYTFEFDGCDCEHCYASEAEATAALGIHAFLHRGAVGRLDEIKEQFDMHHTARQEVRKVTNEAGTVVQELTVDVPARKAVEVEIRDGKFILTDDTGAEHVCNPSIWKPASPPPDGEPFKPPMVCEFKQITEGNSVPVSLTPAAEV